MDLSMKNLREGFNDPDSHTLALQQQHMFIKEAFSYLLDHFEIQAKTENEFTLFTDNTGRAIITLSYIFRRRIRTFFKNAQINFGDINDFQKIAENFEVVRDKCYFFRILRRISHIFELTIFCFMKGYNYTEYACEMFVIDENTEFFEINGGFARLNETALFISEVGEIFSTVIIKERPQDEDLMSFVNIVEHLEKPFVDSVITMNRGILSSMKRDVLSQLEDIDLVDPRVAKVFYHTMCQHSSKVFVLYPRHVIRPWEPTVEYELNIESEKQFLLNSFRSVLKIILGEWEHFYLAPSMAIKMAGCFVAFRHVTDLISFKLDNEQPDLESRAQSELLKFPPKCYSLKEYFMVPKKYILQTVKKIRTLPKPDELNDSIEQPSIKNMYIKNLRRVLDANIEQNNFFILNNGWYVVYTPDCKFDDNTTSIIVND